MAYDADYTVPDATLAGSGSRKTDVVMPQISEGINATHRLQVSGGPRQTMDVPFDWAANSTEVMLRYKLALPSDAHTSVAWWASGTTTGVIGVLTVATSADSTAVNIGAGATWDKSDTVDAPTGADTFDLTVALDNGGAGTVAIGEFEASIEQLAAVDAGRVRGYGGGWIFPQRITGSGTDEPYTAAQGHEAVTTLRTLSARPKLIAAWSGNHATGAPLNERIPRRELPAFTHFPVPGNANRVKLFVYAVGGAQDTYLWWSTYGGRQSHRGSILVESGAGAAWYSASLRVPVPNGELGVPEIGVRVEWSGVDSAGGDAEFRSFTLLAL